MAIHTGKYRHISQAIALAQERNSPESHRYSGNRLEEPRSNNKVNTESPVHSHWFSLFLPLLSGHRYRGLRRTVRLHETELPATNTMPPLSRRSRAGSKNLLSAPVFFCQLLSFRFVSSVSHHQVNTIRWKREQSVRSLPFNKREHDENDNQVHTHKVRDIIGLMVSSRFLFFLSFLAAFHSIDHCHFFLSYSLRTRSGCITKAYGDPLSSARWWRLGGEKEAGKQLLSDDERKKKSELRFARERLTIETRRRREKKKKCESRTGEWMKNGLFGRAEIRSGSWVALHIHSNRMNCGSIIIRGSFDKIARLYVFLLCDGAVVWSAYYNFVFLFFFFRCFFHRDRRQT